MKKRRARPRTYSKVDTAILFADVKGFSKLTDHQSLVFLQQALPLISNAIGTRGVHEPNTWGDGIVAFFDSPTDALRAALNLRDSFRRFDWESAGLPRLHIRVALHAGEVHQGWDPIRRRYGRIGIEVNRAARIEPIVASNHVYVTAEFRQRCKMAGVDFHELGSVALAKAWGEDFLYVAVWEGESVDVGRLLQIKGDEIGDALDPEILLGRFRSSQFVRRLAVASEAKRALARHAVESGLWSSRDVVFLASGTIPVYLFCELLRRGSRTEMPWKILTNNVIVPVIASLVANDGDLSQAAYPDDEGKVRARRKASSDAATTVQLLSGELLETAAATLPRGFRGAPRELPAACEELRRTLKRERVTHLMMMMTGFRSAAGPAIVGLGMRRFNRALLLYAAANAQVRITMFVEADKLVKFFGKSVDAVKLPIKGGGKAVWHDLCRSGRVTLVVAMGKDNTTNDEGFVRRQLVELEKLGTKAAYLPYVPAPALGGMQ